MRTDVQTKSFIEEYIGEDEIYLDEYEIVASDTVNWLVLKVYGNEIDQSKISAYNDGLLKSGLKNTRVKIIPTSEVDITDVTILETKISGLEKIAVQLEAATKKRDKQQEVIEKLSANISEIQLDSTLFNQVVIEVKTVFPDLNEIGLAKIQKSDFKDYAGNVPVALLKWNARTRASSVRSNEAKIEDLLKERLNWDTLVVVRM